MQPLFRTQLIWVNIPATGAAKGTQISFKDIPELNGVLITGIEAMDANDLVSLPDASITVSPTDAASILLTMCQGSDQRIKQQPMTSLITRLNGGVWKEFEPFQPDWQKCFVEFMESVAPVSTGAVPFQVHYVIREDVPEWFPVAA